MCVAIECLLLHLLRTTQSARELTAATWGQRIAIVMREQQVLQSENAEKEISAEGQGAAKVMLPILKDALQDVWTDGPTDVFDVGCVVRPVSPVHRAYRL